MRINNNEWGDDGLTPSMKKQFHLYRIEDFYGMLDKHTDLLLFKNRTIVHLNNFKTGKVRIFSRQWDGSDFFSEK